MSTDASGTGTGLPPNTPNGADATADAPGAVEGDVPGQNVDPDMSSQDDLEQEES